MYQQVWLRLHAAGTSSERLIQAAVLPAAFEMKKKKGRLRKEFLRYLRAARGPRPERRASDARIKQARPV